MGKSIWVLTKEVNAYDQYGEYFVHAWLDKPHHTELTKYGVPDNRLRHVINGGGWLDRDEDEAYFLKEVQNG